MRDILRMDEVAIVDPEFMARLGCNAADVASSTAAKPRLYVMTRGSEEVGLLLTLELRLLGVSKRVGQIVAPGDDITDLTKWITESQPDLVIVESTTPH